MTQKTASKHTPGPWHWDGKQKIGSNYWRMCTLPKATGSGISGVIDEELVANARLISKAPEMYELLKRLFTLSSNPEQAGDTMWPCSLGQIIGKARRIKAEIDGEG